MRQLLRKLFGSQGTRKSAGRPRSVRLELEQLDARLVPSVTSLGNITGFTSGSQDSPWDRTVARSSASGNYAVTWQGEDGHGGGGIYVRLFRADGAALTGPIHIGSTTSDNDWSPSVAMNASGQFAVAWTHRFSTNDTDIHVQRFNANGSLSGSETLAAYSFQNEQEPSAALDNSGNLMVAYTYNYGSTNEDIKVWTQQAWGATNTFTLAGSTHNEHAPSLALNANGLGVVAYEYDFSSSDHDIYAQRVSTGGFAGPIINNYLSRIPVDTSGANQFDPSASINAYGNFVVSYTEISGGSQQVFARQFDASNNYRGQVSVGDPSDTRNEYESSVAMDNYGRFIVAYTHVWSSIYVGVDHVSEDDDVLAEVFNSDNSVRDSVVWVAGSTLSEYHPTVALGINDLTSNYSGNGFSGGQAVFAFDAFRENDVGLGVSAARAYNL